MRNLALTLTLISLLGCGDRNATPEVAQWALVEDSRIGGEETGPASFTGIAAIRFDPFGQLWVMDRQSPELRVFDHGGRFVRTVGRRGEGPGEIAQAVGFAFGPDGSVWVPDHGLRRYVAFDTSGRHLGTHTDLVHSYGWQWAGTVDTLGRLTDWISYRVDTTNRQSIRRFRDSSLAIADTLPMRECSTGAQPAYTLKAANGMMYMGVPYAPRPQWALTRTGSMWCANGATPEAILLGLEHGDTIARLSFARERLPVSSLARDSAIARIRKTATDMGADEPDYSLIPGVQPSVTALAIDDEGRIRLRVPDPTGTTFELFDATGRQVAEVHTALKLMSGTLAVRGDTVMAVITDEDDVPIILRMHMGPATAQ